MKEQERLIINALYLEEMIRRLRMSWKDRRRVFQGGRLIDYDHDILYEYLEDNYPAFNLGASAIDKLKDKASLLMESGLKISFPSHPDWPACLNTIIDSPLWVWYKGQSPAQFNQFAPVAIVGARNATPYSQYITKEISKILVGQGHPIVSGLARGVDKYAHEACLEAGGITGAVMPCGLTECYPKNHADLMGRICQKGFAISEFPPEYPIRKANFHSRNRLISGLSTSVIIVQAGARSGSLITGRLAAEQGREVFVVPAYPDVKAYNGSLSLIADGANILDSLDRLCEISNYMSQQISHHNNVKSAKDNLFALDKGGQKEDYPSELHRNKREKLKLTALECNFLNLISAKNFSPSDLQTELSINVREYNKLLSKLELKGLVTRKKGSLLLTDKALSCIN